jgi:hypothetical protein
MKEKARSLYLIGIIAILLASGCVQKNVNETNNSSTNSSAVRAYSTSDNIVCPNGQDACNGSCYDPNKFDCFNGRLYLLPENTSGAAAVGGLDESALLKPIQLKIDPNSVYRSDVPLVGNYKNTKELLYNTVVSDLQTFGYRVLPESGSQTNVANKLILTYKEDTTDDEWAVSNDFGSPRIKGTYIRCEVRLRNTTTNADIKKIIYAKTGAHVVSRGDGYRSMANDIYFSAFDDFNEQLSAMIRSVFVKE